MNEKWLKEDGRKEWVRKMNQGYHEIKEHGKESSHLIFIPAPSRWISHMWLFTGMRKWKLSL